MMHVTFTSMEKPGKLVEMINPRQKLGMSLLAILLMSGASSVQAAGASGGLTLIEAAGARAASLGEAYSAVSDDISAASYNPSSLHTLKSGQASFLYQKGLAEDAYGQFLIGSPMKRGSVGLSVGYYNAGTLELYDGTTSREVNAQRDLAVGMTYANSVGPVAIGVTGKYLSSQLIESAKATAFAGDFGLSMPVSSRVRIGGAVQNIGTQLKFVSEGDDLPRIARGGMALSFLSNRSATLMMDAVYHMNEQEFRPAAGLEVAFGLLSIRAGYKGGRDNSELSIGTGIMLGKSSLDYSFGMMDGLDSRHRVSLSMRFSGVSAPAPFVRVDPAPKATVVAAKAVKEKKKEKKVVAKVFEVKKEDNVEQAGVARHSLASLDKKPAVRRASKVYVVKAGDTLAKIAAKQYGTKTQASRIFAANKHLMEDPNDLTVGQKIVLP